MSLIGFGAAPVIADFSARIMRGDRIGIIGPNGCGKTTLIKLLVGELEPDVGHDPPRHQAYCRPTSTSSASSSILRPPSWTT